MRKSLSSHVHLNFAVQPAPDGSLSYGLRTSCDVDLKRCHQLREMHAVMVGGVTYRQERPRLTPRREYLGREPLTQPARIVVTRTGMQDLPPGIIHLKCPDGDLEAGLATLARQGIRSIFVEGGPTLHRELLKQGLVTAGTVYIRGPEPEKALPALYRMFPDLPRSYRMRQLGEGHLMQFNFLPAVSELHEVAQCWLPSEYGKFRLQAFEDPAQGLEHAALLLGDPAAVADSERPPLVRIHSACCTGDLFGSKRCDCGQQFRAALKMIKQEGNGVLLYLNQEGRGIGLRAKALAYALQEQGFDTYEANHLLQLPADARDFSFAVHMLRLLGVHRLRLLTNNPEKLREVEAAGIQVAAQVLVGGAVNEVNRRYLEAKVQGGHHPVLLKPRAAGPSLLVEDSTSTLHLSR